MNEKKLYICIDKARTFIKQNRQSNNYDDTQIFLQKFLRVYLIYYI